MIRFYREILDYNYCHYIQFLFLLIYIPIIGNWDPVNGSLVLRNNKNMVQARKFTDPKIRRLRAAGNVQNVAKVKQDITKMI